LTPRFRQVPLPHLWLQLTLSSLNLREGILWHLINGFKSGLENIGLEILPSHSAVIPVLIGEAQPALDFARLLRENGVFTPAVVRLQFLLESAVYGDPHGNAQREHIESRFAHLKQHVIDLFCLRNFFL